MSRPIPESLSDGNAPPMPNELHKLQEAMASRVAKAEAAIRLVGRLHVLNAWLNARTAPQRQEAQKLIIDAVIAGEKTIPYLRKTLDRFKNLTYGQIHYYQMDGLIHEWGRHFDEAISGAYIVSLPRIEQLCAEIASAEGVAKP